MKKKAVILAAGWGTRLRPLTLGRPKPAIRLLNETLIEHNLTEMKGLIDEVVIVVGYKDEVIKERMGSEYAGIKINYVRQEEQLGTGHAAKVALPYLDDEFLILNGDDLYLREDIEKCLQKNPSILVKKMEDPSGYGQIVTKNGKVERIVEKPAEPLSNLINIGCYYVNKSFFEKDIEKSPRGEYEIIDFLKYYIEEKKSLYFAEAQNWLPVTYPWSILEAIGDVFKNRKEKREGVVEEGAFVSGKVIMEKGSVIKKGSVVEGPVYIGKDTVIGPNTYIKGPTAIHDKCFIGASTEVQTSVIFSHTEIPHYAFIGDSVIGEHCRIGAGVVLINFLFGGDVIWAKVKDKKISTGREKMGTVIGNRVKIGPNVSVMPGVMIADGTIIYPHTLVKENLGENTKYDYNF
jgi:UDP-N-acetylglucosamine diphosphorylase / glucose-1-phosphate thymidylyltransferase / UDP-N-acetylgalactosamine diphosphorylase / glucosamine-1-phosphate N-acetyltransferase / galactosamine-1-phosphate N-acetyltransferase